MAGVIFDCRFSSLANAVGVHAELDAPGARVVYPGGVDGRTATGIYGFFIATGVAPGNAMVSIVDPGSGLIARRSVPVVADTITYLWLLPQASAP